MKVIIAIALLLALVSSERITKKHLDEVKRIVNGQYEIYSYEEHPFKNMEFLELQYSLGLKLDSFNLLQKIPHGFMNAALPESFDSRTEWPSCIGEVRDQAQCGSCWAFGAAESFGDRVCIAEGKKEQVVLSTQNLVSCDYNNYGCQGGYLNMVWDFLATVGITTDKCWGYQSGKGDVPACPDTKEHKVLKCEDQSTPVYYKVSSVAHPVTIADIKAEIAANGPMETGFMVYRDFMSYKSGVYKHLSGDLLGGHAIKVLGWGVEDGQNYWLAANSWGTKWGENGLFKIAEGECQFEAQFYAGAPVKVTENSKLNFLE